MSKRTINHDKESFTPVGRLAWHRLHEDQKREEGDPYDLTIVWPTKSKAQRKLLDPLIAFATKIVQAAFGPKGEKKVKQGPFRDGIEKEEFDGFGEGTTFASAKTKFRPLLFVRNAKGKLQEVDNEDRSEVERHFYPGCWVRVLVGAYTFGGSGKVDSDGNQIKPGFAFNFTLVEKVADGEQLASGGMSSDDAKSLLESETPLLPPGVDGNLTDESEDDDEDDEPVKPKKPKKQVVEPDDEDDEDEDESEEEDDEDEDESEDDEDEDDDDDEEPVKPKKPGRQRAAAAQAEDDEDEDDEDDDEEVEPVKPKKKSSKAKTLDLLD